MASTALFTAALLAGTFAVSSPSEAEGIWYPKGLTNPVRVVAGTSPLIITANTSFNLPYTFVANTELAIIGINGGQARVVIDSFAGSSSLTGRRANGTITAPTALLLNENLVSFTGRGYGATAYSTASDAAINISAAENYTDAAHGTYIGFNTTPVGSIVPAENMRIGGPGVPSGAVSLFAQKGALTFNPSSLAYSGAFTVGTDNLIAQNHTWTGSATPTVGGGFFTNYAFEVFNLNTGAERTGIYLASGNMYTNSTANLYTMDVSASVQQTPANIGLEAHAGRFATFGNFPMGGILGLESGTIVGLKASTDVNAAAAYLNEVMSLEVTNNHNATNVAKYNYGIELFATGVTQASGEHAAIGIGGIGVGGGWKTVLALGTPNRGSPCGATCSLISADTTYNATRGIDFRNVTFSGNTFDDGKVTISSAGAIATTNTATPSITSGDITQNNTGNWRFTLGGAGSLFLLKSSGGTNIITSGATGTTIIGNIVLPSGAITTGGGTFTASTGELGMTKITASGTAPGAGTAKFDVVAGTAGGSCKLIMYAGTSATPVTVVDNVGAGCQGFLV